MSQRSPQMIPVTSAVLRAAMLLCLLFAAVRLDFGGGADVPKLDTQVLDSLARNAAI